MRQFDDGREIALLHFIYNHARLEEMRGNPARVLEAIDEYGRTQKYLMNVGPYKSRTVVDLIQEVKPQVMVELGGYVGYSAIAFGAAVRAAGGGGRYLSLEKNAEFGAVIAMLVDLAGLRDVVQVVVGSSADSLRRLHRTGALTHIDLLFLDHYKPAYTADLKLCEELRLVGPGSVYAADNGKLILPPWEAPIKSTLGSFTDLLLVVKPGNPPYLKYVRSTVEEKRNTVSEEGPKGRPELVYESKFIEGWEPSGVPVSPS